jgi:hypothetical protein
MSQEKEVIDDISDEEKQDWAALQAKADSAPPVPGAPEPEPEPVVIPLAQEIAAMLKMISGVAAPMFPTVGKIYTDEVCGAIGGVVAPVCEKHGWLQEGIGGKWGEEIMCLVVVAPIAWATVEAAKQDAAARRQEGKAEPAAARLEAARVPTETPGAKTVSCGAPIPGVEA